MVLELFGALLQSHDLLLLGAVAVAIVLTLDGEFSYLSDYLPASLQMDWLPRIAISTLVLVVAVTNWIYTEGGVSAILRELAYSLFGALVIAVVVGWVIRRER